MIWKLVLGFCFWLGYKSGYYLLDFKKKNTISLNELTMMIVSIIAFPISIGIAISTFVGNNKIFFENIGKIIIIRKK